MEKGEIGGQLYPLSANVFVASILNLRCSQRESRDSFSKIFERIGDFCTTREQKQRFLLSGGAGEGVVMSNDIDYMLIDTSMTVNEEPERKNDLEASIGDLIAITTQTEAGFSKLLVVDPETFPLKDCTRMVNGKYYLSSLLFIQKQLQKFSELSDLEGSHGPAVLRARASELHVPSDNVFTLKSPQWPRKVLQEFRSRVVHTWLTKETISYIEECGCFYVPVGHPLSLDKCLEWRLSFSIAEIHMIKSLNKVQYNCYNLLKLLGERMQPFKDDKYICSYFFKTALFWTIEEEDPKVWVENNILTCIGSVLVRMGKFYQEHCFPNYFIPSNNMIVHLSVEKCSQLGQEFTNIMKDLLFNIFCSLQLGVTIKEECMVFFKKLELDDFEGELLDETRRDIFYRKVLDCLQLQDLMEAANSNISISSHLFVKKHRRDIRNDLQNFLDPNLFDFLSGQYTFETKRNALLSVIENIKQIVTEPKLSMCYKQVLYRALGNLCHIEAMCKKDKNEKTKLLQEAEDCYMKGLQLVFPDGFDDQLLSGKVHLAQFHYMNSNLSKAAEILNEVHGITEDNDLAIEISDACVCTEICVSVHLESLKHDKGLFEYFSTLSLTESKFINSVVLAHYLKLKCHQESALKKKATTVPDCHLQTEVSQKTNLKQKDVSADKTVFRYARYQDLLKRFENFCTSFNKTPSFSLLDKTVKDSSKILLQIVKEIND